MRSIGWTPWDPETDEPARTTASEGRWFSRKNPMKIYPTEKRALLYSPTGFVKEVFVL